MATECSARTGICEPDEALFDWMKNAMPDLSLEEMRQSSVIPDKDANYDGGIHIINLSDIEPMVAHPGNPNEGIPSDPTNGALIVEIGDVAIDIAYGVPAPRAKKMISPIMHRYVRQQMMLVW